jgi:hypothetical protein
MTSLKPELFGSFSIPVLLIGGLFVVLLIVALYRKDHVKAGFWVRSVGFFFEADDEWRKK